LRLLKGSTKASETKSDGRLVALPVKLCEPHPDLQTRLKYDQVDALAEDIRVHGQLQPGRAVERPDGTGYWIYMGIGRLLAIKELFEKDGEPRSYYALLDEGLPFVELFSRSMSENLKRRNLSVLEEVRSFYLASQKASEDEIVAASSRIGEEPAAVRRRIELAKVLGDKLSKMYDMEAKAQNGFAFQIGHLEALAKVGGEKALYEAAAAAANARFSVKELQSSLRNNSIDKVASGLPEWFYEIFPEYAMKEEKSTLPKDEQAVEHFVMAPQPANPNPTKPAEVPSEPQTPKPADQRTGVSTTGRGGSQPPAGVVYSENQPFVGCPHCGAQTPFNLKEDSELTLVRFRGTAVPEKDSVSPEGSYRRLCGCLNPECGEEFWLWSAIIDGELKAEAKAKDDEGWFSLPKGEPRIGAVSWSAERKSWVVREKGSGKEYLYGEDRKFIEA
jgi:ParB-like chromosome segregation protein Spo0J